MPNCKRVYCCEGLRCRKRGKAGKRRYRGKRITVGCSVILLCGRMACERECAEQHIAAHSQSNIFPDLISLGPAAFTLTVLHSNLTQGQAHQLEGQYIQNQPRDPPVYNILQ